MPEATEDLVQAQDGPVVDGSIVDQPAEGQPDEGTPGDGPPEESTADEGLSEPEAGADDAEQSEDGQDELEERRANEEGFSWQASEFVHHHKGVAWYLGLAAVVIVPAAGLVWLHYWPELGALLVGAVALLVYANKAPKTMVYELSHEGIAIDGRNFPYSSFRSFSVLADTDWHTIELEPAKRFQPAISVLFDTPDLEKIVGHLELHIPRDDQPPDLIDTLSRKLRF